MDGMRLVAGGILLGWAAALVFGRFLAGFLFGIQPDAMMTPLVPAVVLAFACLLAVWGPAQRAARLDPITRLRAL